MQNKSPLAAEHERELQAALRAVDLQIAAIQKRHPMKPALIERDGKVFVGFREVAK